MIKYRKGQYSDPGQEPIKTVISQKKSTRWMLQLLQRTAWRECQCNSTERRTQQTSMFSLRWKHRTQEFKEAKAARILWRETLMRTGLHRENVPKTLREVPQVPISEHMYGQLWGWRKEPPDRVGKMIPRAHKKHRVVHAPMCKSGNAY